MRSIFALGLLLCVVVVAIAQKDDKDGKLFFTSRLTIFTSTTTSVTTLVSTTTCTTSTAALSTCTNGRRRRGLFYQEGANKARRGLFFDDDEDKSSVFLPSNPVKRQSVNPVDEVKPSGKPAELLVPVQPQSGFSLPKQVDNTRFLLAFTVSTATSTTISTSTSKLTAVCSSTTGFAAC